MLNPSFFTQGVRAETDACVEGYLDGNAEQKKIVTFSDSNSHDILMSERARRLSLYNVLRGCVACIHEL